MAMQCIQHRFLNGCLAGWQVPESAGLDAAENTSCSSLGFGCLRPQVMQKSRRMSPLRNVGLVERCTFSTRQGRHLYTAMGDSDPGPRSRRSAAAKERTSWLPHAKGQSTGRSSAAVTEGSSDEAASKSATQISGDEGEGRHEGLAARQEGAEWLPVEPLWRADVSRSTHASTEISKALAPAWRLLLLSDGSVTRHLGLLTGNPIAVDCLEMRQIGDSLAGLPADVALIAGPRLQRQVHLHGPDKKILAYAASWWAAGQVGDYLREVRQPIWENLSKQRAELYREVCELSLGTSAALEDVFGAKGPFWARHYLFYQDCKPLTVIYEVFSPYLEAYLGPMGREVVRQTTMSS